MTHFCNRYVLKSADGGLAAVTATVIRRTLKKKILALKLFYSCTYTIYQLNHDKITAEKIVSCVAV